MTVITTTAEATYLTKPNIVFPGKSADKTAALTKAQNDVAAIVRVTSVTGGSIK